MKMFSIRDLENLSGIKAHTIRVWEQRYNFLKPKRTDTNIRYYDSEDLKIILNTALLNKYGYKVSQIDRMKDEEVIQTVHSLTDVEAKIERIVNQMLTSTVNMDLDEFEEALDEYIQAYDLENTIKKIIFPFLNRVGILWSTSHISPAQEHFVSNIIRQKIISGLEKLPIPKNYKRSVLMFLPEGEYHEIGLLFTSYLLKLRKVKVYYLGAAVPLEEVVLVAHKKQPDFLHCHLTIASPKFNFNKYVQALQQAIPNFKIILSGYFVQKVKNKTSGNIHLKYSLDEVLQSITQ